MLNLGNRIDHIGVGPLSNLQSDGSAAVHARITGARLKGPLNIGYVTQCDDGLVRANQREIIEVTRVLNNTGNFDGKPPVTVI